MALEDSFRVLRNIKVELVCPVLYLKPEAAACCTTRFIRLTAQGRGSNPHRDRTPAEPRSSRLALHKPTPPGPRTGASRGRQRKGPVRTPLSSKHPSPM